MIAMETSASHSRADSETGAFTWAIDRIQGLRSELAEGDARLRELQRMQAELHEGMLRISGAIQVLEEMIATSDVFDGTAGAASHTGP